MNPQNRTLGLAEAAQQLRIPYQQAHRLVLVGILPGEKRHGRWYVDSARVKHLAESKQVRPHTQTNWEVDPS